MTDAEEFLQIRAWLHSMASTHADSLLADSIGECIVYASGGQSSCPLGAWLLEEYASCGRLPRVHGPTRPEQKPTAAGTRYDRPTLLEHAQRMLEERARMKNDSRCLDALHACRGAMNDDAHCALHAVWRGMLPPHSERAVT